MHSLKHILKKNLTAVLSILFLIFFATAIHVFAVDWPYAPGVTLNPGCTPGSASCVVTIPTSGWSLTGDASTVDGTNFIGTTDDIPFNIKVNNQKAGRITSGGNTFYGYQAGNTNTTGDNNTILGATADVATNATNGAIALGFGAVAATNEFALPNTITNLKFQGDSYVLPTSDGAGALTSDGAGTLSWAATGGSGWSLTGDASTVDGTNFIGTTDDIPFNIRVNNQKAGRIDNTLFNSFYGYQAGYSNTTGSSNTALGYQDLYSNTIGGYNTALGFQAGYSLNDVTATYNVFIGYKAGYSLEKNVNYALGGGFEGRGNIYIGREAGYSDTSSVMSIVIGSEAAHNGVNLDRAILIGNGVGENASGDNILALGDWAARVTSHGITAIGTMSGTANTIGDFNAFYGHSSGYYNVDGSYNTALGMSSNVGTNSSYNTSTGAFSGSSAMQYDNSLFGSYTGYNLQGIGNTMMGKETGAQTTTGDYNTFLGKMSGATNTTGDNNTYVGKDSGYTNSIGSGNVFLGYQAGYYETGDNKLFIDNQNRTDEATSRTSSLIYGVFSDVPASQTLTINGTLNVSSLPVYADDVAAGVGGLVAGDFYQTDGLGAIATAGVVMVKQ